MLLVSPFALRDVRFFQSQKKKRQDNTLTTTTSPKNTMHSRKSNQSQRPNHANQCVYGQCSIFVFRANAAPRARGGAKAEDTANAAEKTPRAPTTHRVGLAVQSVDPHHTTYLPDFCCCTEIHLSSRPQSTNQCCSLAQKRHDNNNSKKGLHEPIIRVIKNARLPASFRNRRSPE